jgi:uncharacterized protein YdiU (UPF0061 family)
VEEALAAASEQGDPGPLQRLLDALTHPYAADAPPEFTSPPPPGRPAYQTFCGT